MDWQSQQAQLLRVQPRLPALKILVQQKQPRLLPVTPVTWGTKRKRGIRMDFKLPKYSHTGKGEIPLPSKATSEKLTTGPAGKDKHNAPTTGGDGKYPE
tara:strand:- start:38 stop:334 length:297 start_codon:yes stop_codon:yes gene_type:complete